MNIVMGNLYLGKLHIYIPDAFSFI